jgi:hypothetical protein
MLETPAKLGQVGIGDTVYAIEAQLYDGNEVKVEFFKKEATSTPQTEESEGEEEETEETKTEGQLNNLDFILEASDKQKIETLDDALGKVREKFGGSKFPHLQPGQKINLSDVPQIKARKYPSWNFMISSIIENLPEDQESKKAIRLLGSYAVRARYAGTRRGRASDPRANQRRSCRRDRALRAASARARRQWLAEDRKSVV